MMQGYYKSPRCKNIQKSPNTRNNQSNGHTTEKIEIKEKTLEMLLLQIDQMRRDFEHEKKTIHDSYLNQIQFKQSQQHKQENELASKNNLLEQLLLQEQNKNIQLTRILQEKTKQAWDKERDFLKTKILQLEQLNAEYQKSTTLGKQPKDNSYIMMLDLITSLQNQIVKTSKQKKLNISWMDYEVLDSAIYKQQDKCRFIGKLNRIVEAFFACIQETIAPSLSPYKASRNTTPLQTKKMNQDAEATQPQKKRPLTTTFAKKVYYVTQETQTTDVIKKNSVWSQTESFESLHREFSTQPQQQVSRKDAACQFFVKKNAKDVSTMFSQQDIVEEEIRIESRKLQQDKEEGQVIVSREDKQIQVEIRAAATVKRAQESQTAPKVTHDRFQLTEQVTTLSTTSQTSSVKIIYSERLIDCITQTETIKQTEAKSIVVTHIHTQTQEPEEQMHPHQPSKITEQEEESQQGSDSSFDVNNPDNSQGDAQINEQVEQLKFLMEQKDLEIRKLEEKIKVKEQQIENFLNFEPKIVGAEFAFDISVTSPHCDLNVLLTDKWHIRYDDSEAAQIFSIGIVSPNQKLLKLFLQSVFESEADIHVELSTFHKKFYTRNFSEGYRLQMNVKSIKHPDQIVCNAEELYNELNFYTFWLKYLVDNSKLVIYLADSFSKEDIQLLQWIEAKNRQILICNFSEQAPDLQNFKRVKKFDVALPAQVLKLPTNQKIVQMAFEEIAASDLQWENEEAPFFETLQAALAEVALGNEDFFQMGMNESDFELSCLCEGFNIQNLYNKPKITKEVNQKQIKISIETNQQPEVDCLGRFCVLRIEDDLIIEKFETDCRVAQRSAGLVELALQ